MSDLNYVKIKVFEKSKKEKPIQNFIAFYAPLPNRSVLVLRNRLDLKNIIYGRLREFNYCFMEVFYKGYYSKIISNIIFSKYSL